MGEMPYAMFRFNGEVITMNERQFKQAVADARICRCNNCLCCRAHQYWLDNEAVLGRTPRQS